MKKLLYTALTVAAVAVTMTMSASPAKADNTYKFTIENDTGKTLKTYLLTASKDEEWGDNMMKPGEKLEDGEQYEIDIDDDYYKGECSFDVKLFDTSDHWYRFENIDICKNPNIKIYLKDGKPFWHKI